MDTPLAIPAKRYSLVVFFLLAFIIAWSLWIPAALAAEGLLSLPFPVALAGLLGSWGPSLVGILMTVVNDGRQGLRLLFKRFLVWRVGIQWYLFVLLWPAVLSLLVTALSVLLGGSVPDFANPPVMTEYPVPPEVLRAGFLPLLPMVFVTQFFGSAMGEEFGWRGFALPRLQARWNWVLTSGILGVLWGFWHLPRLWVPGDLFDFAGLGWFMLGIVLNTVLYTWVFNSSKGSLLLVVLFHTAQPVTSLFLARASNPLIENVLLALLVVLVVAMSKIGHSAPRPEAAGSEIS